MDEMIALHRGSSRVTAAKAVTRKEPMLFKPYGPFVLTKTNGAVELAIRQTQTKSNPFWRSIGELVPGLPGAIGCFIIAKRRKNSDLLPWYVGQTCRRCFAKEVFGQRRGPLVKSLLKDRGVHEIGIILFAYQTMMGQFRRATRIRMLYEVRIVEELLMGAALVHNPDLANIRYADRLRRLVIPGFLNGEGRIEMTSAKAVAELFGTGCRMKELLRQSRRRRGASDN